jgi:hypothetical protein
MTTTTIFAEILIIGLQATVWFAFGSAAVVDIQKIDMSVLKGWEGLITLFVLAIAYTLGTVIDRVADSVFNPVDRRLRKRWIPSSYPQYGEMKLRIMSNNGEMERFLAYVRSRVRIARSTALNCILIICAVILLRGTNPVSFWALTDTRILTLIVISCIAGLTLTSFTWARIARTYYRRLVEAYDIVQAKKTE